MQPLSADKALDRLQRLCATSEQCTYDLRAKLYRWGIIGKEAETIIRRLCVSRFCDNNRYAKAFVNDKLRFNKWGKRKIILSLRQKHIDKDIIEVAISDIDEEEYLKILEHIIHQKAKSLAHPLGHSDKNRLLRFALSRGFEPNLSINAIIKESQWISDSDEYPTN